MLIAKQNRGPPVCLRALYILPVCAVLFAYVLFIGAFIGGFVATRMIYHHEIPKSKTLFFDYFIAFIFGMSATLSLVSYLKCVFTNPGTSRCSGAFSYTIVQLENAEEGQNMPNMPSFTDDNDENEDEQPMIGNDNNDNTIVIENEKKKKQQQNNNNICKKCNLEKPIRSHHCAICNYCVLEMDHHCPWTGNCIGKYNYKYFFLFVMYGAIACIINSIVSVPQSSLYAIGYTFSTVNMINFISILSIGISFSLSIFVCMHSILICLNTTTIEIHIYNCKRFPFRLHTIVENIKVKFGANICIWFLPISPHSDKKEGKCCVPI